jgi:hypothetical protein
MSKAPLLVGLSIMLTTSCTTMQNVSLKENPNSATRPSQIDVRSGGQSYVVYWPIVRGDSIHGWKDAVQTMPLSFAISDIQRARSRQVSTERTVAAVIGVVAGAYVLVAAFFVIMFASDGGF